MIIKSRGQFSLKTISKEEYKICKTDVLNFCISKDTLYSQEDYILIDTFLRDDGKGFIYLTEENIKKQILKRIINIVIIMILNNRFMIYELIEMKAYPKSKIKYYEEADWNMYTDVIVDDAIKKPSFLGNNKKKGKVIVETVCLKKGKQKEEILKAISSVSRVQLVDGKIPRGIIACLETKCKGKLCCTIVEVS